MGFPGESRITLIRLAVTDLNPTINDDKDLGFIKGITLFCDVGSGIKRCSEWPFAPTGDIGLFDELIITIP